MRLSQFNPEYTTILYARKSSLNLFEDHTTFLQIDSFVSSNCWTTGRILRHFLEDVLLESFLSWLSLLGARALKSSLSSHFYDTTH